MNLDTLHPHFNGRYYRLSYSPGLFHGGNTPVVRIAPVAGHDTPSQNQVLQQGSAQNDAFCAECQQGGRR